jgi:PAS domain S-box-containing protein
MFSPVSTKCNNHQVLTNPHDATGSLKLLTEEVDDVRQLEERTNLIRFGTNAEGIVDDWNYNATFVTGFAESEAIGTSLVNNFVREPIRASFQEVLDKALSGEETSKYVLECTCKEETVLYLLINVEPRLVGKDIVGTTMSGQDMTESIKKDREMYAMARELRQLVDTANAPIFGIDKLGNVNEWNKTAESPASRNMPVETHRPSHRNRCEFRLENASVKREQL